MNVYIGADHRGFEMKEALKGYLEGEGYSVIDMGAMEKNADDDYPDAAKAVAQRVAGEPESRGILLCGSGAGVDVAANKIKGVRATLIHQAPLARAARADDDINILALGADHIGLEQAKEVVTAFLETPFSGEERHRRRLDKIADMEKGL